MFCIILLKWIENLFPGSLQRLHEPCFYPWNRPNSQDEKKALVFLKNLDGNFQINEKEELHERYRGRFNSQGLPEKWEWQKFQEQREEKIRDLFEQWSFFSAVSIRTQRIMQLSTKAILQLPFLRHMEIVNNFDGVCSMSKMDNVNMPTAKYFFTSTLHRLYIPMMDEQVEERFRLRFKAHNGLVLPIMYGAGIPHNIMLTLAKHGQICPIHQNTIRLTNFSASCDRYYLVKNSCLELMLRQFHPQIYENMKDVTLPIVDWLKLLRHHLTTGQAYAYLNDEDKDLPIQICTLRPYLGNISHAVEFTLVLTREQEAICSREEEEMRYKGFEDFSRDNFVHSPELVVDSQQNSPVFGSPSTPVPTALYQHPTPPLPVSEDPPIFMPWGLDSDSDVDEEDSVVSNRTLFAEEDESSMDSQGIRTDQDIESDESEVGSDGLNETESIYNDLDHEDTSNDRIDNQGVRMTVEEARRIVDPDNLLGSDASDEHDDDDAVEDDTILNDGDSVSTVDRSPSPSVSELIASSVASDSSIQTQSCASDDCEDDDEWAEEQIYEAEHDENQDNLYRVSDLSEMNTQQVESDQPLLASLPVTPVPEQRTTPILSLFDPSDGEYQAKTTETFSSGSPISKELQREVKIFEAEIERAPLPPVPTLHYARSDRNFPYIKNEFTNQLDPVPSDTLLQTQEKFVLAYGRDTRDMPNQVYVPTATFQTVVNGTLGKVVHLQRGYHATMDTEQADRETLEGALEPTPRLCPVKLPPSCKEIDSTGNKTPPPIPTIPLGEEHLYLRPRDTKVELFSDESSPLPMDTLSYQGSPVNMDSVIDGEPMDLHNSSDSSEDNDDDDKQETKKRKRGKCTSGLPVKKSRKLSSFSP